MSSPFPFWTDIPDARSIAKLPEIARKAMWQFLELYHFLSARAVVTILPAALNRGSRHMLLTANLGFVPEHLAGQRVVVVSQAASSPRCEQLVAGKRFLEEIGCEVHTCPYPFGGEAELRYLYGNIYVGGYSQLSSRMTYDWLETRFGLNIVKLEERDSDLCPLACSVFSLNGAQTLVATCLFGRTELRALEKVTEIIPVSRRFAMMGGCSSVMLGNQWLNGTMIDDLDRCHPFYTAAHYDLGIGKN